MSTSSPETGTVELASVKSSSTSGPHSILEIKLPEIEKKQNSLELELPNIQNQDGVTSIKVNYSEELIASHLMVKSQQSHSSQQYVREEDSVITDLNTGSKKPPPLEVKNLDEF